MAPHRWNTKFGESNSDYKQWLNSINPWIRIMNESCGQHAVRKHHGIYSDWEITSLAARIEKHMWPAELLLPWPLNFEGNISQFSWGGMTSSVLNLKKTTIEISFYIKKCTNYFNYLQSSKYVATQSLVSISEDCSRIYNEMTSYSPCRTRGKFHFHFYFIHSWSPLKVLSCTFADYYSVSIFLSSYRHKIILQKSILYYFNTFT